MTPFQELEAQHHRLVKTRARRERMARETTARILQEILGDNCEQ